MTAAWLSKLLPPVRCDQPLVHVTHAKAGSTWIDRLLRELFGRQVAPRQGKLPDDFSFAGYSVFSAVFMARDKFLQNAELAKARRFVVIRDLRDTMVSNYFSLRDTHTPDEAGRIQQAREILRAMSVEDGLLWVMENRTQRAAALQRSWVEADEIVAKYEELILDDLAGFDRLLNGALDLRIPAWRLGAAVERSRFESVFARPLGEEDRSSHGRKGLPGDWRNHFTPRIAEEFARRFGEHLVATGYEPDIEWARGGS
jgi:lipopolysaccharide transport system ATP-binding protein